MNEKKHTNSNYADMCLKAEETGAIGSRPADQLGYECYAPRAWTCEELAGMIEKNSQYLLQKDSDWWQVFFWVADEDVGRDPFWFHKFPTLPEVMLFIVMAERGWFWTGKEFERRGK